MQNIGLALFVLGAIGLVLYLVVQVINNPKILGRLAQTLRRIQRTVEDAKKNVAEKGITGLANLGTTAVQLTLDGLVVGDQFHFDENGDSSTTSTTYTVIETGRFTALKQIENQPLYNDTRTTHSVLIAEDMGGTKALFWKQNDKWFAFTASAEFPDTLKDIYKAQGKAFGAAEKIPGSVSMHWENVIHSIQYIGFMRYSKVSGDSTIRGPYYLPDTVNGITPVIDVTKVMITHGSGFVYYFEQMATPEDMPAARLPLQISLIWKGTAVPNQPGYIFE